uniref:TIL domain-containing protein n=1 Tax=Echeneis naucrates TaxID=173247 RepID=A0A665VAR4_ECHNA
MTASIKPTPLFKPNKNLDCPVFVDCLLIPVSVFTSLSVIAALTCPPNSSQYIPCGPACPQPSCQDPAGPGGSCNQPCVDGCFCNPGLVLSGDKCVQLSECGCTNEDGKYRPVCLTG